MWYVKMYMNTGFNLINVPDNPSLLEQKTSKKFGVIDCLQRYFLPSITIRATEDQVIHGDFLKLYDTEDDSKFAYYVINGYEMTSGDTIVLDVSMEPLLTCGGIDNITILDGMTSRHHLAAGEQIPTEKDPLLVPKKVFVKPVAYFVDGIAHIGHKLIVRAIMSRSALNYLANRAVNQCLNNTVNLTASYDSETQTIDGYSGVMCSTPSIVDLSNPADRTEIKFKDYGGLPSDPGPSGITTDASDCTYYWQVIDDDKNNFSAMLKRLTELGREDVILDAYFLPTTFIDDGITGMPNITKMVNAQHRDIGDNILFCTMSKSEYMVLPHYGTKRPSEFHNKGIFFGDNFAYTFLSPDNGQSIKVNPEEFYKPSADYDTIPEGSVTPGETPDVFPKVLVSYDLRPGGNMTFHMMPTVDTALGYSLFMSRRGTPYVLSTGPWDTASLSVNAVSGGIVKAKAYQASSYLKDVAAEVNTRYEIENKTRGLRHFNLLGLPGYYQAKILDAEAGSIGTGNRSQNMQTFTREALQGNEYGKARFDRMMERAREDTEFMAGMVPKTEVISKSSGSCLLNGQGLIVFRNYVSSEDIERFDRIINKYGSKHTTMLTHDMLTNRPLFNYIETQGVSIKCSTVPKSVRDELANAFNTGLRIWHVKDVNVNAWNDPVEEES